MNIPEKLQYAIEMLTQHRSFADISQARHELTEKYDPKQNTGKFISSQDQRLAYLAARMPATYVVIKKVLNEVKQRAENNEIQSLLDLGAGPGSVMWAASEVFTQLEKIHLVEKDAALADIGKKIARHHNHPAILQAEWKIQDLEKLEIRACFDLITLSYVIGELPASAILPLIEKCWKSTEKILVIIEPGTPTGFERIRTVRRHLISLGAYLTAPCPHAEACPMSGGDWCHFSERVERSFLHRYVKQGSLGYEDEKYSYVAVSKTPCKLPSARILRHPLKRSGHIQFTLCTPEGLMQEVISKKSGDAYKHARKLEWGDAL